MTLTSKHFSMMQLVTLLWELITMELTWELYYGFMGVRAYGKGTSRRKPHNSIYT